MRILTLLLTLLSISLFSQNNTGYNNVYCELSRLDALQPIRQGIPGKQPFWNEKAIMFKHAPAFPNDNTSWIIPRPKYYRYAAFSFTDKKYYTFTGNTPYESLTPIWDQLPIGEVYLKVEAVSMDEKNATLAGSRLFYKAAVFCPPYPKAKYSYEEAFLKGLRFMYSQSHIQNWYKSGKPDHDLHQLYCYSALEVGSVVNAMLLYHKNFPRNDTSLTIAGKAADYLIANAEPQGSPLEYFPQVYEGVNLAAGKFGKEIIMTEPAATGKTFLALYERTGNEKYFNAALRIAQTYIKTQMSSGAWYIRINKETGKHVTEELCIPIGIANFLNLLVEKYHLADFQKTIDRAINWIRENPMQTFNWTGQFEDVAAVRPYQNLTKYEASWFAQYLLKNMDKDTTYLAHARELIRFCEDQFVVWEKPGIYDNWGNSSDGWHVPAVLEQYSCYVPIDASAVQMIETFYLAYGKTKEPIYFEKAVALANSVVNAQQENGKIPTFWAPGFDEFWNNCMVSSLTMLEKLCTIQ
jgi:maltose/maltodextrin transport system substrate-binding protein